MILGRFDMMNEQKPSRDCQGSGGRRAASLVLGVVLVFLTLPVWPQAYPSKPIRFVVATGPGNATDVVMRLVAGKLAERRGWATLVENKPGANFVIGTDFVAKSVRDGYTALAAVSSLTLLPSSTRDLPFDLLRDLAPVTRTANLQNVLYAGSAFPAHSLSELVAYAKANSGKLSYATQGSGSVTHLTGELMKRLTGMDLQNIPYKDTTGITNVMNGMVSVGVATVPSLMSLISAGRLQALAILGPKRSPVLQGVPTMGETGFPEIDSDAWLGVMLPAGTPEVIVGVLNREIVAVIQLPEVRDQLLKLGAAPVAETPQEFRRKIESDLKAWADIVRQANIKFD